MSQSEPRLTNRTPYVVLAAVVLLAVGAFIGWRVYQGRQAPAPVVVARPQVVDAGVPEAAAVNLADGDALLKDGASGLSGDAEILRWLSQPDIIRRLVAAAMQISEGESPHETLGFIVVPGTFSVVEEGGGAPAPKKGKKPARAKKKPDAKMFMSKQSTARYDPVAKAIDSVDAAAAGRLYARARPFAQAVFREIAPPGKKLDDAIQTAIEHLAAVPLSDAPLELTPMDVGVGYRYVNPELESLSRAQKHLLRMGPANAKIVVDKLKAFRAASSGG